jgi:hypothetical protein
MTFWYGTTDQDPRIRTTDLRNTDPARFVSDLQYVNKKYFLLHYGTFTS